MPQLPQPPKEKITSKIHSSFAHSYVIYFAAVLIGLILDIFIPVSVIPGNLSSIIGIVFLLVAPALIIWAQMSSEKTHFDRHNGKPNFAHGPYAFMKSPTHFGLDILIVGFGFLLNSIFMIIFSIISFLLSRFVFVKKAQQLLEEKYGSQYTNYKKSVPR